MTSNKKNIIHFEDFNKKRAGVTLDTDTGILKFSKRAECYPSSLYAVVDGVRMPFFAIRKKYPFKDIEVENGNKYLYAENHCLCTYDSVLLCTDSMEALPIKVKGSFLRSRCLQYAQLNNPELIIPKQFQSISERVCEYSNITSVIITGTCEIKKYAFVFSKLKNINFGEEQVTILDSAFTGVDIEELYLPSNVTAYDNAFRDMPNLKKVICEGKLIGEVFSGIGKDVANGVDFVFTKSAQIEKSFYKFFKINSITVFHDSQPEKILKSNIQEFEGVSIYDIIGMLDKTGKIQSDISLNYELNESFSFNIFRDCRTFQEKKDRLIDLIKSGMITAGFAMAIISAMTPNKAFQEQIKQEVIEVSTEAEKSSQNANIEAIPKFNENVVFATDWKISNDGIKHIKRYEKFSATPYYATQKDKQNDIKTIGYGHVIKDSDPDWLKNAKSITEEEASILFEKDIDSFGRLFKYEIAPTLNRGLRVPEAFPQVMMDAMLSMMYNSGNGNFKKDSINPFYARLKNCRLDKESGKIDKRDYDYTIASIPNSLIYHRGEVMKGLQNRRQTEYKMAAQAK